MKIFCLIATLTSACTDLDFVMYEETPDSYRTVPLWVEPHPFLPAEATRQACETWKPEGVLCELVDDADAASIRVRVDPRPCMDDPDGNYALAYSQHDGTIGVILTCFRRQGGGTVDVDAYRVALAHETGHVLGIWYHIPVEDGGALMNPMLHEDLRGITMLDHEAFLGRDTEDSALDSAPDDCVLTAHD